MASGAPRSCSIGKKIACNLANSVPIATIVLGPRASLKSRWLGCRNGSSDWREFGARRWHIAAIQIANAESWTIIKGVLKYILMVYEEAFLGSDLERGGVQYA